MGYGMVPRQCPTSADIATSWLLANWEYVLTVKSGIDTCYMALQDRLSTWPCIRAPSRDCCTFSLMLLSHICKMTVSMEADKFPFWLVWFRIQSWWTHLWIKCRTLLGWVVKKDLNLCCSLFGNSRKPNLPKGMTQWQVQGSEAPVVYDMGIGMGLKTKGTTDMIRVYL